MKKVCVLLSTYNGELFLTEQLDSLYAQEGVDIHILVRDDGSRDSSVSILEEYKNRLGRLTLIKGDNIGVGPSFLSLINVASSSYKGFDYYAFCDQDDVWFKYKVKTGIEALDKSNRMLKLFFASSISTDAILNPISSSCNRIISSFGANLVANHILGCSMLFNEQLLLEINKINTIPFKLPNGNMPIHDAWTALVAYSLNADVVQGSTGLLYYRQHSRNVIGSGHGFWSIQKNRIMRYLGEATHEKANKCIIALQVFGDRIPKEHKSLIELVANYRDDFKAKLRLLSDKRMYGYGVVDNFGTFLAILFNKF